MQQMKEGLYQRDSGTFTQSIRPRMPLQTLQNNNIRCPRQKTGCVVVKNDTILVAIYVLVVWLFTHPSELTAHPQSGNILSIYTHPSITPISRYLHNTFLTQCP